MSECATCLDTRLVGGFLPSACPSCASGDVPRAQHEAALDSLRSQLSTVRHQADEAIALHDVVEQERDGLRERLAEALTEGERMRAVFDAACAWRAVRLAPFPEDAQSLNEMLEPEGRAQDALYAAIDSAFKAGR